MENITNQLTDAIGATVPDIIAALATRRPSTRSVGQRSGGRSFRRPAPASSPPGRQTQAPGGRE